MIYILIYLDTFPPLVLIVLALFMKNKGTIRWDHVLSFILVQTICNACASIIPLFYNNNLFVYHINGVLSLIVLSIYFRDILINYKIEKIIYGIVIFYILFFISNLLFWENITTFNSNSFGLTSLIVIVYCLLYYVSRFTSQITQKNTSGKDFWYIHGIFTYYASCFLIFISYNKLTTMNLKNTFYLWEIHNVIFFVMCIFIFVGILSKRPIQENVA